MQIKSQWDSTQLLEWLKWKKKNLTITSASEDIEELELSYTASGTTTLENSLAVSYKMKHIIMTMTQQC